MHLLHAGAKYLTMSAVCIDTVCLHQSAAPSPSVTLSLSLSLSLCMCVIISDVRQVCALYDVRR